MTLEYHGSGTLFTTIVLLLPLWLRVSQPADVQLPTATAQQPRENSIPQKWPSWWCLLVHHSCHLSMHPTIPEQQEKYEGLKEHFWPIKGTVQTPGVFQHFKMSHDWGVPLCWLIHGPTIKYPYNSLYCSSLLVAAWLLLDDEDDLNDVVDEESEDNSYEEADKTGMCEKHTIILWFCIFCLIFMMEPWIVSSARLLLSLSRRR